MEKTIEVRIKHKFDTHENWTSKNPVLLNGELIFVATENGVKQKIGNGIAHYTGLPFTDDLLRNYISDNIGFANSEADMIPDNV